MKKNQQGLTAISWLVIIGFLAFQIIIALNIAPAYFTDSSIGNVVKGLETDVTVRGKSPKRLREIIMKRLKINNVYDFDKKSIKIKKKKNKYNVVVEYVAKGKIFGNLFFLAEFKHESNVPSK